jgi:hypothetical protein
MTPHQRAGLGFMGRGQGITACVHLQNGMGVMKIIVKSNDCET